MNKKYVVTAIDNRKEERVNVSHPLTKNDAYTFMENLKLEQRLARNRGSEYYFYKDIKVKLLR